MRKLVMVALALAGMSLPAFAQQVLVPLEDAFDKPRPDLVCVDMGGGNLRVMLSDAAKGNARGFTVLDEPVILEKMPDDWRAANFEVIVEGGNCIRRAVSRNLDQEDLMLQNDARQARKAAREAVKGDPKKLDALVKLQGADESVVEAGRKIELPRVPVDKRAAVKAAIAKEAADRAAEGEPAAPGKPAQ